MMGSAYYVASKARALDLEYRVNPSNLVWLGMIMLRPAGLELCVTFPFD